MPAPNQWKAADLTPAVIKASDGSIRTVTGQRDGSRPSGPAAPEFTTSTTSTSITATITDGKGADSYESRIGSGSWNTGLSVSGLSVETPYTFQVRGIDDIGTGPAANVSLTTDAGGVIFSDNFDAQPDWTSGLPENDTGAYQLSPGGTVDIVQRAETHTLPTGWDFVRQAKLWAPSTGFPDMHEVIEITDATIAENPNRARGGTGKSFVSWRDSSDYFGDSYFNSDGILLKKLDTPLDQVYVEFWVNFSDEMIATYYGAETNEQSTGIGKLFRIYHDDPSTGETQFFGGNNNPHFVWGFSGRPAVSGGYGFRNHLSFLTRRDGDSEGRYLDSSGQVTTDEPSSYISDIEVPNTVPNIRDGGLIDSGVADIDKVFGDETHWTKMAFFIKMNSAPGVFDGVFKQWIDDYRIQNISTMNWVESDRDMVKWTSVAIGGNDWFNKYPDSMRIEEWYAIDDFVIRDSIPQELL